MPDIEFDRVTDPDALAGRWRALEAICQGGFFRGWSYLGTLFPHFSAPHLLAVRQQGQDVALGLFNRSGGRLFLHETGNPVWDSLYIEHNGLLMRPGAEDFLKPALAAALAQGTLVLSGTDDTHRRSAFELGKLHERASDFAPALDLACLNGSPRPYLDTLSANARAQIRRAMRLYGDSLAIERAQTTPQALAWFGRLVALHQSRWTGRGAPGAFADRRIRDFHAALIAVGLPRGEIDMLRISAGPREVGMLYQFRHGGRILSYQSGFTAEADARLKPGLVCHTLAIRRASAENAIAYDFMAGAQRYKTTLAAKGGQTMHWLTVYRPGSWAARWRGMKDRLRGRSAGAGGGTGSGDPSCEA